VKRKDVGLFHGGSESPLDRNISRLVKLADGSDQPSKAFAESLVNGAMGELGRSAAGVGHIHDKSAVTISQWEKVAAMLTVVCSAGVGIFVSIMAHLSSVFAAVVLIAVFVNKLIYYGGLIL